jgi:hypothetical protein
LATQKVHSIPFSGSTTVASGTNYATSTTPSAEIVVGSNRLVRIAPSTATLGVFVRFGPPGTNVASANDVYIPYGAYEVFDTGKNTSICFYSTAAGTAQVTIVNRS